eukprot:maker-scaffold_8-snap-gene-2.20-mRNA-1 protein AED:0.10 eAED:0.10 QI:111/1/1/1/0/0/2/106/499
MVQVPALALQVFVLFYPFFFFKIQPIKSNNLSNQIGIYREPLNKKKYCGKKFFSITTRMKRVKPTELPSLELSPIDDKTLTICKGILDDIKATPLETLLNLGKKFKEIPDDATSVVVEPNLLEEAFNSLPPSEQNLLVKTANQIHTFAAKQKSSIQDFTTTQNGVKMGQRIIPVATAGCYAPGGRYPLPSSVLMTMITAKVAGVSNIVLASPKCSTNNILLAAAHAATISKSLSNDIEESVGQINCTVLSVGGPHSIFGMALGVDGVIPKCDVIVGPGNQYVTAAKQLMSNVHCRIDMLAGPSECLVLADESAEGYEDIIAADLLAQAEHDVVALPILVTSSEKVLQKVNVEVENQLKDLSTKDVAEISVRKGLAVKCDSLEEMIETSESLAPEHLELFLADEVLEKTKLKLKNYGGLFVGKKSAEVFGDYGVGPNHTLPTSGTGRYIGGLSVFNFLKMNTWIEVDQVTKELVEDCAQLARLEGLEGHARAAEKRKKFL